MSRWLNDLYKKNKLHFALAWIGLYCIANSLANPISAAIGIDSSANFTFNLLLTIVLSTWIHRENAAERYGLCRAKVPAGRFLWYVPLILFMTHNLWFGLALNLPAADTVCYVLNMLCVGFLEEVIFRGFLFRALEKDNAKTAIVVSSVTFGLGHILNLFNGSGMELAENAVQVVGAIACGFLFVVMFHRGGSLIPCIVAHSVNNALSAFANEAALTSGRAFLASAANLVIVAAYTLILCKTLPEPNCSQAESNE